MNVGSELQRYEFSLTYQLVSEKRQQPLACSASIAATSRETGIARETLRAWKAQGVEIFNRVELLKRAETRKASPSGTLGELKQEKLQLECDKLRQQIEREGELWMRTDDVLAQCRVIGILVRTRFMALCGTLPDRLAGCEAPDVHRILKNEIRDTLEQLSREPLMPEHEESIRLQKKIIRHEQKRQPID
jgi:hypothetical protein